MIYVNDKVHRFMLWSIVVGSNKILHNYQKINRSLYFLLVDLDRFTNMTQLVTSQTAF